MKISLNALSKIDKDERDNISLADLVDKCHKIFNLKNIQSSSTEMVQQYKPLQDNGGKSRIPCWECKNLYENGP